MNKETRKRLESIDPDIHAEAAARRLEREADQARFAEVLRRYGADPAEALMPDGTVVVSGDDDQYIGVLKAFLSGELGIRSTTIDITESGTMDFEQKPPVGYIAPRPADSGPGSEEGLPEANSVDEHTDESMFDPRAAFQID
jgi:hypothetical protein